MNRESWFVFRESYPIGCRNPSRPVFTNHESQITIHASNKPLTIIIPHSSFLWYLALVMTETNGAERRRFRRIGRDFITYYRRIDSASELAQAGLTRNISSGGVLVTLDEEVRIGDRLSLELLISPDAPPLNAIGRVARIGADGVGIEFERCDEPDRKRLERFLASGRAL